MVKYSKKHLKECYDHYKCTRVEDHAAGKHTLGLWWCERCVGLEIKAEERITLTENLFNFKRWFNGMKKFSSIKTQPPLTK